MGAAADTTTLDQQRAFISGRRAELNKELNGAAPAWTYAERNPSVCVSNSSAAVSGKFSTTWGDINATTDVTANALVSPVNGKLETFTAQFASAGLCADATTPGCVSQPGIRLTGLRSDGRFLVVQLLLGKRNLMPGEIPLQGFESLGVVAQGTSAANLKVLELIGTGKIVFDKVGMQTGDVVSSHFEGQMISIATLPAGDQAGQ